MLTCSRTKYTWYATKNSAAGMRDAVKPTWLLWHLSLLRAKLSVLLARKRATCRTAVRVNFFEKERGSQRAVRDAD
ncbi:MAG: glycine/sarcosine/betaine reductase selenoprotein B family protein [Coprococcus sp.]